jgi:hypothetical protein
LFKLWRSGEAYEIVHRLLQINEWRLLFQQHFFIGILYTGSLSFLLVLAFTCLILSFYAAYHNNIKRLIAAISLGILIGAGTYTASSLVSTLKDIYSINEIFSIQSGTVVILGIMGGISLYLPDFSGGLAILLVGTVMLLSKAKGAWFWVMAVVAGCLMMVPIFPTTTGTLQAVAFPLLLLWCILIFLRRNKPIAPVESLSF